MENFIFCFLCSVAFFQIVLPRRLTSLVLVIVFSRLRKFNAQTKTFDTISCLSCSPQYLHIVKYLFLFVLLVPYSTMSLFIYSNTVSRALFDFGIVQYYFFTVASNKSLLRLSNRSPSTKDFSTIGLCFHLCAMTSFK